MIFFLIMFSIAFCVAIYFNKPCSNFQLWKKGKISFATKKKNTKQMPLYNIDLFIKYVFLSASQIISQKESLFLYIIIHVHLNDAGALLYVRKSVQLANHGRIDWKL